MINTKAANTGFIKASLPGLFILMLFLSSALMRKNKKLLGIGIFILIAAGGCEKNKVDLPDTVSTIKHSRTIIGLLPNTTYYWKIIASAKNGYKTESKVYSFLTSDFNNHKNQPGISNTPNSSMSGTLRFFGPSLRKTLKEDMLWDGWLLILLVRHPFLLTVVLLKTINPSFT